MAGRHVFVGWALALACLSAPDSWCQTRDDAVAQAVLFSSPTCPHCRVVREQVLPSLGPRFGSRLHVFVVNTATSSGLGLYYAALKHFDAKGRGVPMLIVGDSVLIGPDEIQTRLPPLLERCLAQGGASWPEIPGLKGALALAMPAPAGPQPAAVPPAESAPPSTTAALGAVRTAQSPEPQATAEAASVTLPTEAGHVGNAAGVSPRVERRADVSARTAEGATVTTRSSAPTPTPRLDARRALPETNAVAEVSTPAETGVSTAGARPGVVVMTGEERPDVLARVAADPFGNGLAIVALIAMIGIIVRSLFIFRRGAAIGNPRLDWLTPILAVAGVGIAAYLAHVEVHGAEAVCGPVGDCNAVQQSEYARLFGVLPIGVLGVVGFSVILLVWIVRRVARGPIAAWAGALLLTLTAGGTLFSIYLTFLEPFVIGATCLWCLSSSVLMTSLYCLALGPGRVAFADVAPPVRASQ